LVLDQQSTLGQYEYIMLSRKLLDPIYGATLLAVLITMTGCGGHADPSVAPSVPAAIPDPAATPAPAVIVSPGLCPPLTGPAAKGAVPEQLCVG